MIGPASTRAPGSAAGGAADPLLTGTAARRGARRLRRAPRRGRRPSRAYDASAAAGSARTTSVLPAGSAGQPLADQVPQPAADLVADHGGADGLGDDEAGAGRCGGLSAPVLRAGSGGVSRCRSGLSGQAQVDDDRATAGASATANRCGEVAAAPQSLRGCQHDCPRPRTGPGRPQADRRVRPLARRVDEDGAAGPGAHAQPEAVGLRAPAVVRLVGALAHVRLSVFVRPGRWTPGSCGGPGHLGGGPRSVLPGGAGLDEAGMTTTDSKHTSP